MDDYPELFRPMTREDIPDVVRLSHMFFEESEFAKFSTFSPDNLKTSLESQVDQETFRSVLFVPPDEEVKGYLFHVLESAYTFEPISLMWLYYVHPRFRRTPVGRLLLDIAIAQAKDAEAVAFYAGAMANIETVGNTLPNLYRKKGFEDLAFWGRRLMH